MARDETVWGPCNNSNARTFVRREVKQKMEFLFYRPLQFQYELKGLACAGSVHAKGHFVQFSTGISKAQFPV